MDKNAIQAKHTFWREQIMVVADPTRKEVEAAGRPDLKLLKNGYGITVEVKQSEEHSIKLLGANQNDSGLRPNQVEYIETWCLPYNIPVWLYVTIGRDNPNKEFQKNYDPIHKHYIKRTWLVPYKLYMHAAKLIEPYQKSLPQSFRKTKRLDMCDLRLNAEDLWYGFELEWVKGGYTTLQGNRLDCWVIPEDHLFRVMYLAGEPLPLPSKELDAKLRETA